MKILLFLVISFLAFGNYHCSKSKPPTSPVFSIYGSWQSSIYLNNDSSNITYYDFLFTEPDIFHLSISNNETVITATIDGAFSFTNDSLVLDYQICKTRNSDNILVVNENFPCNDWVFAYIFNEPGNQVTLNDSTGTRSLLLMRK